MEEMTRVAAQGDEAMIAREGARCSANAEARAFAKMLWRLRAVK